MKPRVLALSVALAMPAVLPTAHAATLTVPELHVFTQHVCCDGIISSLPIVGGRTLLFTQTHLGQVIRVAELVASIDSNLFGLPPYPNGILYVSKIFGDGASVSFTVLDSTDQINWFVSAALRSINASLTHTINGVPADQWVSQVPLPAALPLFAAGLGIVTFIARRRKTTAAVLLRDRAYHPPAAAVA